MQMRKRRPATADAFWRRCNSWRRRFALSTRARTDAAVVPAAATAEKSLSVPDESANFVLCQSSRRPCH